MSSIYLHLKFTIFNKTQELKHVRHHMIKTLEIGKTIVPFLYFLVTSRGALLSRSAYFQGVLTFRWHPLLRCQFQHWSNLEHKWYTYVLASFFAIV